MSTVKKPNPILDWAIIYAFDYGMKVVPCYGIKNGVCACKQGANCKSPGKHPRLNKWEQQATSTDRAKIETWFERPYTNLGVQFGPASGVIDIEWDTEDGFQRMKELLLYNSAGMPNSNLDLRMMRQ